MLRNNMLKRIKDMHSTNSRRLGSALSSKKRRQVQPAREVLAQQTVSQDKR
jgi:hypothetical protein